MSLESWKKEYLPEITPEIASDPILACKHSLKKWQGLYKKILGRYEVRETWTLTLSGTCALCHYSEDCYGDKNCDVCPIVLSAHARCNYIGSAWHKANENEIINPAPMIRVLKRTLKWLEEQK